MNLLKKTLFLLAIAVAIGWIGANTASACVANTAIQPNRQQGTTELIGVITINCSGGAVANTTLTADTVAASPGGSGVITVTLTAGTFVTTAGGGTTGCGSTVDNVTKFPCPAIYTNTAAAYAPTGTTAALGAQVTTAAGLVVSTGGNTATFNATWPAAAIITITGLRVNMTGVSGSVLTASITLGGPAFPTGLSGASLFTVAQFDNVTSSSSTGTFPAGGFLGQTLALVACSPLPTPSGTTVSRTPDVQPGNPNTLIIQIKEGHLGAWRAAPVNGGIEDTYAAVNAPFAFPGLTTGPALPNQTNSALGALTAVPGSNNGTATTAFGIGTRLVAVLTGIPTGFVVWVPRNLTNAALAGPTVGTTNGAGVPVGGINTAGYAILRVTGAANDGSGGSTAAPLTSGTTKDSFDQLTPDSTGTVAIVYEVVSTSAAALNPTPQGAGSGVTVTIPAVFTSSGSVGTGAITASEGAGPGSPPVNPARPQFAPLASGKTAANAVACASYLLFPWVANTNDGNFDTGIAIANTSSDPPGPAPGGIGTTSQTGDVTMFFFPSDGSASFNQKIGTGVKGGSTVTFVASSLKKVFLGYAIAVCGFSYGHGFAFIDNPIAGQNGFAQGYVALSLDNPRKLTAGGLPVGGSGVVNTAVEWTGH